MYSHSLVDEGFISFRLWMDYCHVHRPTYYLW